MKCVYVACVFYSCFLFSFAVCQIVVEEQQKEFALFAHIQSRHSSGTQDFQVRLLYNNIVHRVCRCIIIVDVVVIFVVACVFAVELAAWPCRKAIRRRWTAWSSMDWAWQGPWTAIPVWKACRRPRRLAANLAVCAAVTHRTTNPG